MQDRLSVLDQFDQAQIAESFKRVAIPVVSIGDPSAHGEERTSRGFLLCDRSAEDIPVIAIQPWEHYLLGLNFFHRRTIKTSHGILCELGCLHRMAPILQSTQGRG